VAFPSAHARYAASTGVARRQLQWLGWGFSLAGLLAVTLSMFRLLVDWPHALGQPLAAASLAVPLGVGLAWRRNLAVIDRLLAHTVAAAGLCAVVLSTYV